MDAKVDTQDEILFERLEGGIARVTFNRPQARNAFTFSMYERLGEFCGQAGEDPEVRAIILTGAGDKAFAAGTDINQFRAFKTPQDAIEYEARISKILSAIEACPKPVVAAINGACTGGGGAIAAVSDIRIASAHSRYGFPIAKTLGNILSMASFSRLVSLVGPSRAKEMIFTARLIGAEEALQAGLLHEVVPEGGDLQARALEVARTIAGNAPLTLRATKEAIRRLGQKISAEEGEDLVLMCYMSEDFREGMDAFLNKRPPQWKGR
ncbi:enoyl-CoA hydratase/isomerase family protein [Teichococcus vastitatis]|uniref:Enoyl-CoA hydratase/isomerase family protein n=1 Tax=Teichococcus vastitatis TaxID=2307076 RepID=A0ABS9W2C3_9PROT|nr:enoyl-CoA hydratase/isomerase family protein [Pseudoroseomonas vastitatis]MCI0753203.1 enoyl-CoA hydratase/isomerase family protein [Pseudoroseomonas vastitatis]